EVALDQAQIYRMRRRAEVALEHAIDFRADPAGTRRILDQIELPAQHRERSLAPAYEEKVNRREAAVALRDQQTAKWRRNHADPRLRPADNLHRALDARPRLSDHGVEHPVVDRRTLLHLRRHPIGLHLDYSSSLSFLSA